MLIIADQVYQENLYEEDFVSFKKVICEIESPYNEVELASIHSVSKGFMGECGLRGGYIEFHNIDPDVLLHFDKIRDIGCVNVTGCIAVGTYSHVLG